MGLSILKVFGLSAISFFVGVLIAPALAHFLYKHKAWKKQARIRAISGEEAVVTNKLLEGKEIGTPRMGGILIWATTLVITLVFWALFHVSASETFEKLNFLSRSQTWLPLFALVSASLIGLADDFFQIRGRGSYIGGGLSLKKRLLLVALIGLIGGWWFFAKLEVTAIAIPFTSPLEIGWLIVPLFVLVMLAAFSGGVIDGLDGLAGGIFASIFAAYAGIAFFQNQMDLAAFCGVLAGAISAFLWFNIPPARFYMGETGVIGLTATLTVVAFLTDSVLVLPIIAFPLVMASGSAIIQIFSKKFFHKKVFLAAPIHYHFEARGWPSYKVTMRFWLIGAVFAIIGIVITLIG